MADANRARARPFHGLGRVQRPRLRPGRAARASGKSVEAFEGGRGLANERQAGVRPGRDSDDFGAKSRGSRFGADLVEGELVVTWHQMRAASSVGASHSSISWVLPVEARQMEVSIRMRGRKRTRLRWTRCRLVLTIRPARFASGRGHLRATVTCVSERKSSAKELAECVTWRAAQHHPAWRTGCPGQGSKRATSITKCAILRGALWPPRVDSSDRARAARVPQRVGAVQARSPIPAELRSDESVRGAKSATPNSKSATCLGQFDSCYKMGLAACVTLGSGSGRGRSYERPPQPTPAP